jgi:hypothetical protein
MERLEVAYPDKNQKLQRKALEPFECAVIMDYDFLINDQCPHCQRNSGTHEILDIEEESDDGKDFFMGQIVQCNYCDLPIIILQYPLIYSREPIFLKWTVFEELIKNHPKSASTKDDISSVLTLDRQ